MKKHTAKLLLPVLSLACTQAFAYTPSPEDYVPIQKEKKEPQQAESNGKKLPVKYPIRINVNDKEVKAMLEEHLPLISQQEEEELDKEQLGFLAEETPENVITMLKTKGYFNGKVTVEPLGEGYQVNVAPGPRTKVDNVSVAIVGDVLQDDDLAQYYKSALENWVLPVENPFDQSGWSSSKTSVLSAVTRKKYPLARLSHSQATINPYTNTADLNVVVDSHRPIYFGDIQISGIKRYPESVVRGMAKFHPGSPYDLDQILDYQQALEQDGHYSGASVQADFDNLQGDRVPVKVAVSEVKRHKLEAGVRYDSEYGLGGRIGYDYYNLFNRGYIGSFVVDTDKYETTVAAGVSQPRKSNGHYLTSNVSYTRSTTQNLEKRALRGGIWRVRERNNIESRIGVEYLTESSRVPDTNFDLGRSHATMVTASWKRQEMSTLLRPENGYYLDGKIGSTLGSLLSSTSIARARASAGYYFTPENKKIGTFIARGQVGYVYAREGQEVPSSLRFRTGGATSIRGYELDSIGLTGPNNSVLPERALAVASLEYQYPINKSFSAAVFHDMGDAALNFKKMSLKHGTGVGVRWFSPVAPFSFDIAYGHHDKKVRWHISLGTRF